MTARKMPLSDRLGELSAAVPAAKRRERECDMAFRDVTANVAHLRDAILDAHADGDEQRAAKASKERAKLEGGALRDAEERLEGAKRAVSRAEAERGVFAAENIDGLLIERGSDAMAVAKAAEGALERLGEAHAAWGAMEQEIGGLLRLAGRDTRDLARFPEPLANLVRDARRIGGVRVPAPLPLGHVPVVAAKPAPEPAGPMAWVAGDGEAAQRD